MRKQSLLAVCLCLVLAGCSGQPTLQDTPERPDERTNETMVEYATESERVAMYNGIVQQEDGVEGDLNVSCEGRILYQTQERSVVTVACRASPYESDGADVETWPRFSLHVFDDGTTSVARPSEARTVTVNESAHGSLWVVNTDTSDRNVTVRMLSTNASNATVLDREQLSTNEGVALTGLPDRSTNWLRVEVGKQSVRLNEWQDYFDTRTAVYIDTDGTPRAVTFEYPISDEQ